MATLESIQIPKGNHMTHRQGRSFAVVCAEPFVGEDAAEAIVAVYPDAQVKLVQSLDDAAAYLAESEDVGGAVVISPRQDISRSGLAVQLATWDAPLFVITNKPDVLGDMPCRIWLAKQPFTNETIAELLRSGEMGV